MNYANQAGTVQPARETQTQVQLNRLEEVIDGLEKAFALTAERIKYATRTESDSPDKTNPQPCEVLVPLADRIRKAADRVVGLSTYIANVNTRIEL